MGTQSRLIELHIHSVTANHVQEQNDRQNQEKTIKADLVTRSQDEEAVDEIGEPYQSDQTEIL
jgi:hypothetical protein